MVMMIAIIIIITTTTTTTIIIIIIIIKRPDISQNAKFAEDYLLQIPCKKL